MSTGAGDSLLDFVSGNDLMNSVEIRFDDEDDLPRAN